MRVCLTSRQEPGTTGTSRYVRHLTHGLEDLGTEVLHLNTRPLGQTRLLAGLASAVRLDAGAFLASYPLRLRWPAADVYHLTVQTYASSLIFNPPPGPVVVAVHDIIPYLARNDGELTVYRHPIHRFFDWLAMQGLGRADAILAVSDWTARTLVESLDLAPSRIVTVPEGIDHARFRPLTVTDAFRAKYQLPDDGCYALYVGSEDSRKNLQGLFKAAAALREQYPRLQILKVGAGHSPDERRRLQELATELGLGGKLRFFDHVPDEDLPLFYNAARVCVLPSFYEGFGFPVLEALACGTPVVCTDTSALPETAGGHAVLCRPQAADLAEAMAMCLDAGCDGNREARIEWAANFTWQKTSRQTKNVFTALAAGRASQPLLTELASLVEAL